MADNISTTPELDVLYDKQGTALIAKSSKFPVEIGDTKQADFYPQVKIPVWDNEVNFSVRLVDSDPDVPSISCDKNAVVWSKPRIKAKLYDQGFNENTGGFEFEVWLAERPDTNVLTFSMQSKGLSFSYQSPLANIDKNGDSWELSACGLPNKKRPANVCGSYAVYRTNRVNLHSSDEAAEKYKNCKAFHLFRPWAEDVSGQRVWCDLNVNVVSGLLTVTVPQDFLDSASYPVLVDPTFGYLTHGASTDNNASLPMYFYAHSTPASNGTITSITHYHASAGTATFDTAVYSNNAGAPDSRLAQTQPGTTNVGTSNSEVTTTLSLSITSGTQYWLGMLFVANSPDYAYDSLGDNGGNGFKWDNVATITWPATANSGGTGANEVASIYATYTASGGGSTVKQLAAMGVG